MADEIVIRPATEEDVPDMTLIYNHAVVNTTATFDTVPKTLEERYEWFRRHDEQYPLLVATIDGKVAAWGSIQPSGERPAWRYTAQNAIYVDCDYLGRGLGTALLERLIDLARTNGFHAMVATIVGGNEASVRLHEKLGFDHVGTMREVGWKFNLWLDVLIYEKLL